MAVHRRGRPGKIEREWEREREREREEERGGGRKERGRPGKIEREREKKRERERKREGDCLGMEDGVEERSRSREVGKVSGKGAT